VSAASAPSAEALDWVVGAVPGGKRVQRVQRRTGGITSSVHAITVDDVRGRRQRVVLRRWTGGVWPDGDGDDPAVAVAREAAVLSALCDAGLPAPRLVATDPSGVAVGCPALLMTHLPGRIVLAPTDVQSWVRQLASQLLAIHHVIPNAQLPEFESWLQLDKVVVPAWTSRPDLWREAIDVAQRGHQSAHGALIHHDYQPFNVLWAASGALAGVVDWVWASEGPAAEDVTHCRLNLCLLASAEVAEDFRRAYEAEAGQTLDPWWDVASLVDYLAGWTAEGLQRQAGRRLRIDAASLDARVETLLAAAMQRL